MEEETIEELIKWKEYIYNNPYYTSQEKELLTTVIDNEILWRNRKSI
jgi:hypothetical protein